MLVDDEIRAHGRGPVDEQPHGREVQRELQRAVLRRAAQRRHGEDHLADDSERFTAGREHADLRAQAQQQLGQPGGAHR